MRGCPDRVEHRARVADGQGPVEAPDAADDAGIAVARTCALVGSDCRRRVLGIHAQGKAGEREPHGVQRVVVARAVFDERFGLGDRRSEGRNCRSRIPLTRRDDPEKHLYVGVVLGLVV